jgi:hypothetical protein
MTAVAEIAASWRGRARVELRDAAELWLVPSALALLPYRLGVRLARLIARTLPLYGDAAQAGVRTWRDAVGGGDERGFLADYRFAQLVDHLDLFWALTRSRRFLLRRLAAHPPALVPGAPVLVLSYHYGQGLWLLAWLAAHGVRARFLSVRLAPGFARSTLHAWYARLRIRMVARLAQAEPIFTGGARRAIGEALARDEAVYGLIDVPVDGAAQVRGNATLFGRDVLLPAGLLEASTAQSPQVVVLTAYATPRGERVVRVDHVGRAGEATIGGLAALLERRLREAPAAWHLWHLWPRFLAQPR